MAGKEQGGGGPPQRPPVPAASMQPPIKKLVRQLDFNSAALAGNPAMAAAAAAVSRALQPRSLPVGFQHPQHVRGAVPMGVPQQLQQRMLPVMRSHQMVGHVPLPRHAVPMAAPVPQPVSRPPFAVPLKPESPNPWARLFGRKDSTPTKKKCCNCRNSRCLKLYCECFASGTHCDGCNCTNCFNSPENEVARREAIEATLGRNPDAFRPKIRSSPHTNRNNDCEKGARKMGWAHPAVAMEEVLGLVRGFVDVLVLAGGCTSSGADATWSAEEIKKALRWALFFEEIFKDLHGSGQYEDSARELDAALLELTSSPEFPKGLAVLSSETLSMARALVMRHFLKAKTMSVENFGALLEAVVEMDIDGICSSGAHGASQEYAKSVLDMDPPCFAQTMNAFGGALPTSSDELHAESTCHSWVIVKEFQKTLVSASCTCLAERGLETILNSVKRNSLDDGSNNPCALPIPKTSQMIDEFLMWKQWRQKCLSYLFDKRTIQILSGASLIFKAPKEQWMKVLEPLKSIAESCYSGLVETMELCLLGSITGRWNTLIEGFISHTFCFIPISKKYADLHQCLHRTSEDKFQDKHLNLKEKDILDYARQSLESKPSVLWLLPPVLTAVAIPPRSSLYQIYLAQIDKQFHEGTPGDRKCSCRGGGIDQHRNCEITERIQSLYAFHIQQFI